jgi:hypothetical protein
MGFLGIDIWSDNFGTCDNLGVGLRGNDSRRRRRPTVKSEEDETECDEVCGNERHSADGRSSGSHGLIPTRQVISNSAVAWVFHLPESGIRAKSE